MKARHYVQRKIRESPALMQDGWLAIQTRSSDSAPICRVVTEFYLALFNLAGAAEQRERNSFMRREHPDLGRLSRQPGFRRHG